MGRPSRDQQSRASATSSERAPRAPQPRHSNQTSTDQDGRAYPAGGRIPAARRGGPAVLPPAKAPAGRSPRSPIDPPTVLTPEVAGHRKPARRFQVVGAFVLVVGAVAGVYLGVGRNPTPSEAAPLSLDTASVIPVDNITDEKAAARALVKAKAESAAAAEAERVRKANEAAARQQQEAASRSQQRTATPNLPTSCGQYAGNRALGCAILLEVGFGLDQMGCLDTLWAHESGWNERAMNQSSGAYGIPQALPATKMAAFGADYQTNAVPQIRWGLDYIKSRYGSPCSAWSYWQAHNWY